VITVEAKYTVESNGASLRVFHANTGEGLPKHEHTFDHLTMCHAGSCLIRKEGRERVLTKSDNPINLVANEWHEIEALEDGTVFVNVFAEGKY
jgi:quercetin dioxygenase-like cupin family protein